jgi:hypothetical protein
MKKEQIKTNLSLGVAAILSLIASLFLLTSCSPPNDSHESDHAGVLTETESGRTLAFAIEEELGYVTEISGKAAKKSGSVQFALTKIVNGKTELLDSTTVKYGEYAVFDDATGAYSVVATAIGLNGKKDTLFGAEILKRNDIDTVYVRVQEPATLKISTAYTDFINSYYDEELQDLPFEVASLCITGTLACKEITLDDIKHGYAMLTDIPIINNESSVKQIEIQFGSYFSTIGVDWNLRAGDTLFANENMVAEKVLYDIDFTLPESDLFDSLGDYQLDSLIVPVKVSNDYYHDNYLYEHFFLDERGNVVTSQSHKNLSPDTILHWIVIPKIDSTAKLSFVSGNYNYERVPTYSRLNRYWETAEGDTLWRWINIFNDSSFAISFWIELDSLADSTVLLGDCDSLGFEIRRCQKDSTAICTRIYNGIDTASTDSVEYGKASILDGKRHHYALAIHKKHLAIAVDGITIRDTDLKLSEKFYKVEGIRAATGLVEDILFFSFGDFIRYKGDKSWRRLKAWLYAFYEMQKDI